MSETLAALDKIARAEQAVDDLCSGRLRWEMRVPAEPDHDPDLIISDALRAAREALTARGVRVGDEGLRAAALEVVRQFDRADIVGWLNRVEDAVNALRAALATTPTPPERLRAEIERLCVSWQTAVPVDVLRAALATTPTPPETAEAAWVSPAVTRRAEIADRKALAALLGEAWLAYDLANDAYLAKDVPRPTVAEYAGFVADIAARLHDLGVRVATPTPTEIDVERLARALVKATRSTATQNRTDLHGHGWPAYSEWRNGKATTVDLLVSDLAAAIAAAYKEQR